MVLHFHAHKLGSRMDLTDFLPRERAKGNLCDIKGLKKKTLHQNEVSLSPLGMITHERLGQLTPAALMKGGIAGVCLGRYELSLRICTGRGFTATLALIIVARCLHMYCTGIAGVFAQIFAGVYMHCYALLSKYVPVT